MGAGVQTRVRTTAASPFRPADEGPAPRPARFQTGGSGTVATAAAAPPPACRSRGCRHRHCCRDCRLRHCSRRPRRAAMLVGPVDSTPSCAASRGQRETTGQPRRRRHHPPHRRRGCCPLRRRRRRRRRGCCPSDQWTRRCRCRCRPPLAAGASPHDARSWWRRAGEYPRRAALARARGCALFRGWTRGLPPPPPRGGCVVCGGAAARWKGWDGGFLPF